MVGFQSSVGNSKKKSGKHGSARPLALRGTLDILCPCPHLVMEEMGPESSDDPVQPTENLILISTLRFSTSEFIHN